MESRQGMPKLRFVGLVLFAVSLLLCEGCGFTPRAVSLSDSEIQPLLKAMNEVDRTGLGFTPVSTNARISLELRSVGARYDAMLHVYGDSSRTIAFRKINSGYKWIGEQENHPGPKWHQAVSETFRESVTVEFQTERINGIPTNYLFIRYRGGDTNLEGRDLTLAEIRPILESWKSALPEPRPADAEWQRFDKDFDPALGMFALFLVGAFIAGCIVTLLIAAACIVISTILLSVGLVSAALLVGLLRRSVSAGIRALFIQVGAIVGIGFGILALFGYSLVAPLDLRSPLIWITGTTTGLIVGVLIAWLFNLVWTRIAKALMDKFRTTEN